MSYAPSKTGVEPVEDQTAPSLLSATFTAVVGLQPPQNTNASSSHVLRFLTPCVPLKSLPPGSASSKKTKDVTSVSLLAALRSKQLGREEGSRDGTDANGRSDQGIGPKVQQRR